jgi:hypothetical protein
MGTLGVLVLVYNSAGTVTRAIYVQSSRPIQRHELTLASYVDLGELTLTPACFRALKTQHKTILE